MYEINFEILRYDTPHTLSSYTFIIMHLSISAANKPVLAQTQLVERVLPCINTDVSPVQFKLLATLRMLVDGQGLCCMCAQH
jgi:hypothetical protein